MESCLSPTHTVSNGNSKCMSPDSIINTYGRYPNCQPTPMPTRLKVLVVEDDNSMAQMCAKLIRRRGHSAIVAPNCRDAVRIVSSGNDIDVVVSDVQMPEMDGIQLLAQLRSLKQTLPVVLMTGYGHVSSQAQILALGATDYILKPFDPDAFVACVERATKASHNAAAS